MTHRDKTMSFLEAHRVVESFAGGPPLRFLLGMSGTPDKLALFLKAAAAERGLTAEYRSLPFNTLDQFIVGDSEVGERELFVLFPWDLVPETNWRAGLASSSSVDADKVRDRGQATAERFRRRKPARILYVAAPIPPVFPDAQATEQLRGWLGSLADGIGAEILPASVFSLSSYLATGCPFASASLGLVAQRVIEGVANHVTAPRKVLITDLDNVMWHGVIGEDGLDGIRYHPEGAGFRHFLYQTFLRKLKREGTLLAAVSRNDEDLALAPFKHGRMELRAEDFVAIVASYNAKSSQIKQIARELNLGLDAFVFVDDNPIEITEVSAAIPEITCVQFPPNDDSLPAFFARLAGLYSRDVVTAEDAARTEMYRRRLEGMLPDASAGANVGEYLRGLEMSLTIHDRSSGDRTRAVQLINKTNQFNLNGRRVTDEDVGAALANGGRLYTASLEDRTGSHGEVVACLIDPDGAVRSLVMSCRVFQRRMEYAFFGWLSKQDDRPMRLEFEGTQRNEPIRSFLDDPAFTYKGGSPSAAAEVLIDWAKYSSGHAEDLALFALSAPERASI